MRKNGDLWWWNAVDAGGDGAVGRNKVQAPAYGVGRGKADRWRERPATSKMTSL